MALEMVSKKARKRGVEEANRLFRLYLNSDLPRGVRMSLLDEAYKILLKVRGRKPSLMKLFICKSCGSTLHPGYNAVYRVRPRPYKHVYVKCLVCGASYRKGFK